MGDEEYEDYLAGPMFAEVVSPYLSVHCAIKAIHHTHKSKFQLVQVIDTITYGTCLFLDGHMQSSEKDEFVYHESLVHPVMINHPNPKRIFVGGGGEGATVREILRHPSVEKVVMVDIDGECVDVCKRFLPNHHKGHFDDPRTELIIDDAKVYLETTKDKFDILFFDLSDPIEGGPAKLLYTKQFYEMCLTKLNPGGIIATQGGPAGLLTANQVFTPIYKTLQKVCGKAHASAVFIPSYSDCWGYVSASLDPEYNPGKLTKAQVNERLSKLHNHKTLKFLDGESFKGLFKLPKSIREEMEKEERIITIDTPLVIP